MGIVIFCVELVTSTTCTTHAMLTLHFLYLFLIPDRMCIKDEFAELVDFEVDGNKRVNSQKTSGARERELARTPMRGV